MALYKPPTAVVTLQTPWLALVTRADPDWGRERHHEPEYIVTRRTFYADQATVGAYSNFSVLYQQGLPNS